MNSFNDTMNEEKPESMDLLGIKPISDAINTVTETTMKEVSEFLDLICRPVAEEFGFLLQDRVKYWRFKNLSKISIKAKKILSAQNNDLEVSASPRIVNNILENGSWIDDDRIQEMWAGLLASACSKEGKDESNLIFINLLSQLTYSEVNILNYCCENAEKRFTQAGLIYAADLKINFETLKEISGVSNIHQLDRELDHLRSLSLLTMYSGFLIKEESDKPTSPEETSIDITPTGLTLNLYVRCNGSLQTPIEYFGLHDRTLEHQP